MSQYIQGRAGIVDATQLFDHLLGLQQLLEAATSGSSGFAAGLRSPFADLATLFLGVREHRADELGRNGRIDFLATFGTRQIALELKRCKISTLGDAASKQLMQKQWETVVKQAKEALKHMREHKNLYKSPVSVGLLVIRVNRALGENPDKNKLNESVNALKEIAESVQKATQADFLAYYTSPQEMQISYGWGDKETRYQALPGVVFAAVVHGSTK